jgi:dihydrofolate reductase
MGRVIVIEFVTLDGVIEDPDGSGGSDRGGWAFRSGPAAVAGDKFKLGEVLDTGVLVLGRATWQLFSRIWPSRHDDFANKMNAMPKLVASRTLEQVDAWDHSTLIRRDLIDEVSTRKTTHDLVVAGSASIAHALMARDLVDEYRLLVFPVVIGEGTRLFAAGTAPLDLHLASSETAGEAVLLVYERLPAG